MFCELVFIERLGGVGSSVMVENESIGLEVVVEEIVVLEIFGGRLEDLGGF